MPRIKLKEQREYRYQFRRIIRDDDLNYAGHLGNDRLVSIIQEARMDMFKKLGCTELDLGDGRTGIIIGDIVVNFITEAFSGDGLIIETNFDELRDKGMRLFYKISRATDGKLIALAETGIIAFDYKTRVISEWPADFIKKLQGLI